MNLVIAMLMLITNIILTKTSPSPGSNKFVDFHRFIESMVDGNDMPVAQTVADFRSIAVSIT